MKAVKSAVLLFSAVLLLSSCAGKEDYVYLVTSKDGSTSVSRSGDMSGETADTDEDTGFSPASEQTDASPFLTEPFSDETTVSEKSLNGGTESRLTVLSYSDHVKAGSDAFVNVSGIPGQVYSISVIYDSGPSSAKGLTAKDSDENGNVCWTWKVGSRTKAGTHIITVSGCGETVSVEFTTY